MVPKMVFHDLKLFLWWEERVIAHPDSIVFLEAIGVFYPALALKAGALFSIKLRSCP